MESMTMFYPPEDQGKICITATEQEWLDVLVDLDELRISMPLERASTTLLNELRAQGVTL